MSGMSEASIQQRLRLWASKRGVRLWRNNVGVLKDERGVPVRYGLANESKAMNQNIKSSDLIGITPVTVTPDMVGKTLGVFTAYECKAEDWSYRANKREIAQLKWLELVQSLGGIAQFINSVIDEPDNKSIH